MNTGQSLVVFRLGAGEVNRVAAAVQLWGWILVLTGLVHVAGKDAGTAGWVLVGLNAAAMCGVMVIAGR